MKIVVSGAGGRLGRILTEKIRETEHILVGAVDRFAPPEGGVNAFAALREKADVVIDFSNHEGTAELTEYAVRTGTPVVIATTGHTEEEKRMIAAAAEKIPVFYSGNFSLGIAVLSDLVRRAAEVFPQADIEIVETHHNRKLDAPSGTALMLAEAVGKARPGAAVHCGRSGQGKRTPGEIGIQSVRMGNIAGIHEVMISTDSETITLKHEAHDRGVFADGAIRAAEFLAGRSAGRYDMKDLLKE